MSLMPLATYVSRLEKKVHPGLAVKHTTVNAVLGFLDFTMTRLVALVQQMKRMPPARQTTSSGTIKSAVAVLFPQQLSKFAISYGTTAVSKLVKYEADNKKQQQQQSTANPADGAAAAPKVLQSTKAGLVLPVCRIGNVLRQQTGRTTSGATVFLTGVLEYVARELFDVAGEVTKLYGRKHISANDLHLAIFGDLSLSNPSVLPGAAAKKIKKKKKPAAADEKKSAAKKKARAPKIVAGDAELRDLARAVGWGALKLGWGSVYVSLPAPSSSSSQPAASRKRKAAEVDGGANESAPAVVVGSVSVPVGGANESAPVVVAPPAPQDQQQEPPAKKRKVGGSSSKKAGTKSAVAASAVKAPAPVPEVPAPQVVA